MVSVGIDLIEIKRVKKTAENPRFYERILGNNEFEQLKKRNFPIQSIAANFCAKEAFSKAIGTGIKNFSFSDVEVLRDDTGKPYLKLSEKLKSLLGDNYINFDVSLTHTKEYASAVVIAQRRD